LVTRSDLAGGETLEDKFYMMRFVANRRTFAQDMTDDEGATMGRHVAYWTEQVRTGSLLLFGPVVDVPIPRLVR
jgi:hypothetical protein